MCECVCGVSVCGVSVCGIDLVVGVGVMLECMWYGCGCECRSASWCRSGCEWVSGYNVGVSGCGWGVGVCVSVKMGIVLE